MSKLPRELENIKNTIHLEDVKLRQYGAYECESSIKRIHNKRVTYMCGFWLDGGSLQPLAECSIYNCTKLGFGISH